MARAAYWTEAEEEYLINNYSTTPINQLASIYGRSIHAIEVKANELRRRGYDIGTVCPTKASNRAVTLDIPDITPSQRYRLTVYNNRETIATFVCINREQILVITTRYYGHRYTYKLEVI